MACSYLLHNLLTNVPRRSLRKDRVSKRVLLGLALDIGGLRWAGFFRADAEGGVGSVPHFVGVVCVGIVSVSGNGVVFFPTGVPLGFMETVGAAGVDGFVGYSLGGRDGSGVK